MDDHQLKEKYLKRLEEILKNLEERWDYDEYYAHIDADTVLCDLLEELGFKEVVELYNKIPKWYS